MPLLQKRKRSLGGLMTRPSPFRQSFALTVLFMFAFFTVTTSAQPSSALLLYKSTEESGLSTTRVATKIGPILQKLGLTSEYHDVDQGLPNSVSADVIVSWFSSPKIADPESYIDWLGAQISAGKKVVILGNFGAHTTDGSTWMTNESINRSFTPSG